jgi:protein TonB
MAEMQPTLEQDDSESAKRFIFPAVMAVVMIVGGWLIYKSLGSSSGHEPKRQTVKIAVLPDTPPPPPPPPKEKPPEPKEQDNKPQPQEQQKPQEAPPEAQQLKMDGPAGDGPSAFAAGSVNSEYKGGEIGSGSGGGSVADRMASMSYGNAASRALNEHLNRDQALRKAGDYKIAIKVWVQADGGLERFELTGSTGDTNTDELVRKALQQFRGFRNAPPSNLPQPIRLQLTNRMMG